MKFNIDAVLFDDLLNLCMAWNAEEKELHEEAKKIKCKHKSFNLGSCAALNRCSRDLATIIKAFNTRKVCAKKIKGKSKS